MGPLSLLYKAFLRPLLTYASTGWFPFLSVTNLKRFHRATSRAISVCLLSSPIPFFLSQASLPYELPSLISLCHFISGHFVSEPSFSFQVWPDLGVKPRFCRSFLKAFASTHLLILYFTSPRKVLFARSSHPSWNLLSFTVESILSYPCFCYDPTLSCQGATLAHLDSLPPRDLVLWRDGSFPFGKGGSGVLETAHLLALRPPFPFRQAQYVQVFLLKPASFYKGFVNLDSLYAPFFDL